MRNEIKYLKREKFIFLFFCTQIIDFSRMIILSEKIEFPPVHMARHDGLLAIGGDLSAERLKLAYKSGIFPWYNPPS